MDDHDKEVASRKQKIFEMKEELQSLKSASQMNNKYAQKEV